MNFILQSSTVQSYLSVYTYVTNYVGFVLDFVLKKKIAEFFLKKTGRSFEIFRQVDRRDIVLVQFCATAGV